MENKIILLDGGMGTMLQAAGLPMGEAPESWNLSAPEKVTAIQRRYVEAGSRVLYTNTFGANRLKLKGAGLRVEDVVEAGVRCAKLAAGDEGVRVALDIGPIGQLLEPLGTLSFEQAYELFREQVAAGAKAGADLIVIETMSDLYEVKAAVLAAKEKAKELCAKLKGTWPQVKESVKQASDAMVKAAEEAGDAMAKTTGETYDAAKKKAGEFIDKAKTVVTNLAGEAKQKIADAAEAAKEAPVAEEGGK